MKKLFTLITMLLVGISGMWGQFVPDANAQYTLACCSSAAHSTSPFIGFNNNGEIDGQCTTGTRFKFELAPGNNDGYYIYVVEKKKYFNWNGSTNKVELNNSPTTVWKFKTTKDFKSDASTIPGKYGIIPYQNPNYSTASNKSLNNYNATYNNLRIGPFNDATNACSHWTIAKWYDVSDTETLSEIENYNSYDFFNVPSGSTLNIDVDKFDLTKVSGDGNIVVSATWTNSIETSSLNIEYTGGAGTSESRVSINHNGGSVKLTGDDKTYYLNQSFSQTQTIVNMDGTTVNYSDAMGIGTATYNIDNTQITTPRFITSQGGAGRPAVVNLKGNSVITVTGNTNLDGTTSSIMIGHWNGPSNVTLSGTAQIVAADAQLLVGKTSNNQTITLNGSSNITAKGIKVSAGATGTNTLNLNGGSLNLGDVGITAYGNSMAVNVNENTTITATAATLPLTQPITVAAGKTLTIDGNNNAIVLTGTVTNNGIINIENATIEGGATRDFSTLPFADYDNCTLIVTETTAEFNTDDEVINITNIPSYFTTIKLRRADRRYVTLDVTDGSATFTDSEAKVSGPKCRYDFTFSLETLAERKAEDSSTILNSGSRGSSNGLTYDTGYNSNNSYNNETGLLKVKSTPWRDMTGDDAWPDNYSVAVYANVPDVENGCLMAFGSSTKGGNKYLALIRGASRNEIKLVKGNGMHNAFEVIATMSAENATVAKHLVVFTKSGSTFKVYCDGVNVATTTYSETLGTGFQIGSVHGGVDGTGIIRVNDNNVSSEVRNAVEIQSIRIFDGVLDDDQMSTLMAEFPYVSKGGSYSRTISAYANLGEDNSWAKKDDENTYHIPTPVVEEASTYYPDVTVTTSADATLTVNEDVTFGKTSFGGSGTLTIEADGSGHSINVGGAVIINSNVVVKFGAIDMSTSPVTKGAHANLTFDFSDFNFNKVYATTTYTLTGVISQDDTHITAAGLPSSDNNREYAFAFDDNHYKLIVTVRAPQTVYLPSGTTEIEDDMAVKLTNDAATNNGLLIQGDNLIINNTGTLLFKESSGFCTFEVKDGATVTVNNKTNSDYALDGETITITNGTLKLNYGNGDANINSATITIGENGTLDNYGWLTVDGTLTVNSDYDKTILNNSGYSVNSRIRGNGKIVKGGTGTITMRAMPHCTENEVTTKHPIEITGGVLILSDGAKAAAITGSGTLNVPAATSISIESIATGTTLTGNGNVTTTTFPTTTPITTDWRGTVELAAGGDVGNLTTIFNAWGNANTVIKLNSVTGWFESDYTVNPTLNILSGATVNINNGYSNKEPKLTKVTGAGILQQAWDATGTNHNLHIETLTDFTGTLEGTNQPIIVDRIVLNRKPAVGDLLIKTSGTVSLSSLVVGWQPISAYSWDTETHDEVIGIYVTAKDDVAEKRDLANAIVLQYDGYIGAGVNKYTISLGDDKYTSMESYNDAIAAWTTVDDYVTPSVTINQPTSAFYRIKAGDKYLQDARKSDSATQRTLTDEEGADEDNETLFYLNHDNESNDDTFIGYQSGYGFGESVKLTQDTEHLNSMLFTESSELGKYTIQSQQGTCSSADDNEGYWGVDGSDLSREDDAASGACWTLEPATSVPVTFKKAGLGYATFFTPVALQIPDETNAYVCKLQESGSNAYALTFYEITAIKDADEKTTIPANTAVLLYKSGVKDGNKDEVVVNFPITSCKDEEGKDVKITQNSFYGTLATEAFNVNDPYVDTYSLRTYMVGDAATKVGFYKKTSGTTCAGFKAWLKTDHPVNNEVRIITINFDGDSDPTGIVEALGLEDENVEIYDLNGRKLSSYRKGINIVNGKKVLVK